MYLADINIHPSWREFTDQYLKQEDVDYYLSTASAISKKRVFPDEKNIFRFLETDKHNLKVVILGMDPYHAHYELNGVELPIATGRSFEVASMVEWTDTIEQASLRNILKAIHYAETGRAENIQTVREEIVSGQFKMVRAKDWFDHMERQGVLFLNTAFTVEEGNAGSHRRIWCDFANRVITDLRVCTESRFMLWGKDAEKFFPRASPINRNHERDGKLLYAPHPRMQAFVNENPFTYVKEINWIG